MSGFHTENSDLIEKALSYVKNHIGNTGITVEEVAQNAGFSTNYFNHIFMAHTGFPVMGYIRFERIRKGASLLRLTDKKILDIALEVGFESPEGFSRAFQGQYGFTPSQYRKQKKGLALPFSDLADPTLAERFLHEQPAFHRLDEEEVIDALLAKDAKRFGYLCVSIKAMGLCVISETENVEESVKQGLVFVGDKRNGEYYLNLLCDDKERLNRWCKSFSNIQEIRTKAQLSPDLKCEKRKEFLFFGEPEEIALPEGIDIHQLSPEDLPAIRVWAEGRKDGYAAHLLQLERCFEDPAVLEYGIFKKGRMIAALGCAIERVHEFSINDSIPVYFKKGCEDWVLYRTAYRFVTHDLLKRQLLPFDNIQYGAYGEAHGGFTSEELGYTQVGEVYQLDES